MRRLVFVTSLGWAGAYQYLGRNSQKAAQDFAVELGL
jgi:hypothetical protein